MKRIVEFGINDDCTMEKLYSGQTMFDLVNATGEYLGMIRCNDRDIMITRNIDGPDKGKIMANEIEYDTYPSGNIEIYYSSEKTEDIIRLQQYLNHPPMDKFLSEGRTIREALSLLGIEVENCSAKMMDRVEMEFVSRYDYSNRFGEPAQYIMITGIKPEYFENLKEAKQYVESMTTYQIAAILKQQEKEKQMGK